MAAGGQTGLIRFVPIRAI